MDDQTNNPISIATVTECHRISDRKQGDQILLCSSSLEDKENERSSSLKRKSRKKKRKSKEPDPDNEEKSSRKKSKKSSKNRRRRNEISRSSTSLTSNAIESLIKFSYASAKDKKTHLALEDSQLIVRLRVDGDPSHWLRLPEEDGDEVYDRTLLATLTDGTYTLKVLLLQDPTNVRLQQHLANASSANGKKIDNCSNVKDWIVAIRSLVTTEGYNPKYHLEPIVCLTSIDVLSLVDDSGQPFPPSRPYRFPPKPMVVVPQSPTPSSIPLSTGNLNSPSRLVGASTTSSSTARVRAGRIGTFLDQTLPYCTNEELSYCNDTAAQRILLAQESRDHVESNNNNSSCMSPARNITTASTNNTNATSPSSSTTTNASTSISAVSTVLSTTHKHAENVQTFMTRHTAMMTLQGSSKPTTDHAVPSYTSALNEFASSQLERQTTSLSTNAGREAADRATLITTQHNAALGQALQPAKRPRSNSAAGIPPTPPQLLIVEEKKNEEPSLETDNSNKNDGNTPGNANAVPASTSSTTIYCFSALTPERLRQWHSTLLEGLHPEAGQIRTKTVRAGHTVFCRPKDIESELDKFCTSLASLQHRLDLCTNVWHAVLFAAIAMYGVVDIHPFSDGNGRMSRIVANWALQQFPFSINLFATPAQRAEYVVALESTRHLLSMAKTSGSVSRDEKLDVIKSVGVFAPVMRLLMDRLGRAVIEFNRVWEEKTGLAAEAMECKAARQARERAKEGTCIICLDEGPNIATLCCGKAVHLNCIAEWLSAKNSCPCCRSELPSISGRVVRAARQEQLAGRGIMDSPNGHMRSGGRHRYSFDRERQTARDVIVSLLNNFHHTTTETADEEGYDSAHDTTAADVPDPVDEEGMSNDSSEDEDSSDSDDDSSDSEDDGMMVLSRAGIFSQSSSSSSSDDDEDDDDDSENDNDAILAHAAAALRRHLNDPDVDIEGNTSSTVSESESISRREDGGRAAHISENEHEATNNTLMGAEDETMEGGSSSVQVYCCALYCRNRPAVDCTNNLCGRCCVLGGEFHCPRHNS